MKTFKFIAGILVAFAFSNFSYGQIPLDRSHENLSTNPRVSSFGEALTAQLFPITQISAQYGLLEGQVETFPLNGGTTTAEDSLFIAGSGTNSDGLASILSRRQLLYRAGEGSVTRFTAIFDTPVANNNQIAGLITNTDSFIFGYLGTNFGIAHSHGGKSEEQELTITTGASGSEDATVTIDGVGFTVALTAGTVEHNAFEIAESLSSQIDNLDFSSNQDEVVAQSLLAEPLGTFAFSSSTAVGAWNELVNGVVPTLDFTPQSRWNKNTRPDLDQQTGNVYQIQYEYLGFGNIRFAIENPDSNLIEPVHVIGYSNKNIVPSVGNPTFRVGWTSRNVGNTTNIEVRGASAAAFIEGINVRTEPPRSLSATATAVGTANEINVLTFRNRVAFGNKRNRSETFVLNLTASTDSTKGAIIKISIDSDVAGDLIFSYVDKTNSTMEFATDAGVVTGGRLVASFVIPASGSPFVIQLEELTALLLPQKLLTISARILSGASADVNVSLIWQEDL